MNPKLVRCDAGAAACTSRVDRGRSSWFYKSRVRDQCRLSTENVQIPMLGQVRLPFTIFLTLVRLRYAEV